MTTRRRLGMGLDLLLTAASSQVKGEGGEKSWAYLEEYYEKALQEEEKGNSFEAYYFYRRIIDAFEEGRDKNAPEVRQLVSQALNNAAVLFFENGQAELAAVFLQRAVEICPQNAVAKENLALLRSGGR